MTTNTPLSRGSEWHRWDPHIHAPGTILNDQYPAGNGWELFLNRIEQAEPVIRVLGVTDYYSLDSYEAVVAKKEHGRLPNVDVVFPNLEMRYGVGTASAGAVNVHLLVSPDDPHHVEQARRVLRNLTFDAFGDSFHCERADLIRLGKRHGGSGLTDSAALEVGTNQFKVSPDGLRAEWNANEWMRNNVLIAVVGGSRDGTSGVRESDASSLAALRGELERWSHVIFAAQPKQVEFWLGRGAASPEELAQRWGGPKPCLHGSDAHKPEDVGKPHLDRFCWLKGELTFESLRQACLEPSRAFIGSEVPEGALPSQVMRSVGVIDADWFARGEVPLNAGLVAIIGARGSGKTALADVIAAGSGSLGLVSDRSFVLRAEPLLGSSAARVVWETGQPSVAPLAAALNQKPEETDSPRVQYLSQQFVDNLCSAEGLTDELLKEIERVVYQAHGVEERFGTAEFRELLAFRTEVSRDQRRRQEDAIRTLTEELSRERELDASLPDLDRRIKESKAAIAKDRADRATRLKSAAAGDTKALELTTAAAEKAGAQVDQLRRRRQALQGLQRDVAESRATRMPAQLQQLRDRFGEAGLLPAEWMAFATEFVGDVDQIVTAAIGAADRTLSEVLGPPGQPNALPEGPPNLTPSKTSLIPAGLPIDKVALSVLSAELARLRALIGIDTANAKLLSRLNERISRQEAALAQLDRDRERAQKAAQRQKELIQRRNEAYRGIFQAIEEEETELATLYGPLAIRLAGESGAVQKLSFAVRREVEMEAWANAGEELLDLRKTGPFKGKGALLEACRKSLLREWQVGSSQEVADAMAAFRAEHDRGFLDQSSVDRADKAAFSTWLARLSGWLYGTSHIKVAYSVQYDGVNIEQLSPGTRGIVLLLLYLALDRDDDRPLIIDQPEENLDPKSVFDELVTLFRGAKSRRQVIIVTHNANLVVNADADQVIVANCGPHRPGQLPELTYEAGGLENQAIRTQVCEILEGGERAFRERARRLRLTPTVGTVS